MVYCDAVAQLGFLSTGMGFFIGYFLARRFIWSNKTNQLIAIKEVKTEEGINKI